MYEEITYAIDLEEMVADMEQTEEEIWDMVLDMAREAEEAYWDEQARQWEMENSCFEKC